MTLPFSVISIVLADSKKVKLHNKKYLKIKDLLFLATKLIEEIPDPCNAKESCQWFTRKKNTKSVKQSKIIIQHPKTFEGTNIVDIKSVMMEHPKISHKVSKTIRHVKKVYQVVFNSSYIKIQKKLKFFELKKCENNKTNTCF